MFTLEIIHWNARLAQLLGGNIRLRMRKKLTRSGLEEKSKHLKTTLEILFALGKIMSAWFFLWLDFVDWIQNLKIFAIRFHFKIALFIIASKTDYLHVSAYFYLCYIFMIW